MLLYIQATPEPEIQWKKGGEDIEAGDKYVMVLKPMCGKYKCILKIKVLNNLYLGKYSFLFVN